MKNNPVGCGCKRCRDYNSQVINGRKYKEDTNATPAENATV